MNDISLFRVCRGICESPEPEIWQGITFIQWSIFQENHNCYVKFQIHSDFCLTISDDNFPSHIFWEMENIDEERFTLALIAAQEGKSTAEIAKSLGMIQREEPF